MKLIDLSQTIRPDTPVYPGDPGVEITALDSTDWPANEDGRRRLNCGHVSFCLHCGTHMDAPFHFYGDGDTIEKVQLQSCMGLATLIRLDPSITTIEIEHLQAYRAQIESSRRVILNTGWHHQWMREHYFTEHPVISGSAAKWLGDLGVVLIGVDTPSVDRPPFEAHLEILGRGMLIVENLTNLDGIQDSMIQFAAIPLKILGRDGSPVRALAWSLES